jgi:O-antigen ligase
MTAPLTLDTPAATPAELRRERVELTMLAQIVACVGPSMAVVGLGNPALGARAFFLLLAFFLAANFILGRWSSCLTLIMGTLPASMLLRGRFMFYNALVVFLLAGLVAVLIHDRRGWRVVLTPVLGWLLYVAGMYWLMSFVLTGNYATNLRVMELVLSAFAVVLLAQRPGQLATAMHGVLISLLIIGLALLGSGDRLGMASINGESVGNPISFGMPLALMVFLAYADGGKWLLVQGRPVVRGLLSTAAGLMLVLSASRTSWFVAAAGVFAVVILNGRHRRAAIVSLVMLVVATSVMVQTKRGGAVTTWYNRTFGETRTASQRTSGRSEQWELFPHVVAAAPPWGFGPGSGRKVYARFSLEYNIQFKRGVEFEWHSLYQHLTVETGLLGMTALLALLARMIVNNLRTWRRRGEVVPLLGTLSFMLVALTVSGMDAASGLFLGLGLLAAPAAVSRARRAHWRPPLGQVRLAIDGGERQVGVESAAGGSTRADR